MSPDARARPGARPKRSHSASLPKRRRAPSPEPDKRIAERRSHVAHAARRHRLAVVGGVAVVVALGASVFAILHSSLFSARHVTITGAVHESAGEVLAAAGLSAHPPLIDVDTGAVASGVEALPWVARATVARHWPESVTISIVERTPVGVVEEAHGAAVLIDRTGRVLGTTTAPSNGLVALTDVGPLPAPGGVLQPIGADVARLAGAIPPSLAGRIAAAGYSTRDGLTLTLALPRTAPSQTGATSVRAVPSGAKGPFGPEVLIGTRTELAAKFVALATVLDPAGNPQAAVVASARTIDLRVPTSPVVTPVLPHTTTSASSPTVSLGTANTATTTTIAAH